MQHLQTFSTKQCLSPIELFTLKDIVPHLPTKAMNFHHVATEVWYVEDFSSYQVCDGTGEDPNCSDSVIIPSISDHT